MNIIEQIKSKFNQYLKSNFKLDNQTINRFSFELNIDPLKQQFGDINANAAMILAKQLKQNPRTIAQTICNNFSDDTIEKLELAGPGFINIYLKNETFQKLLLELTSENKNFFKSIDKKNEKKINIEFVSANPTGPLHLGHGRGGIIGDVLGNILNFIGHKASKEFYINDAGAQIKKLATSFKIRCQQAAGQKIKMIEDGYQGEYLIELAKEAIAKKGKDFASQDKTILGEYAKKEMLKKIKKTLEKYGIKFDTWFSEKSLHTNGAIDKALSILEAKNYLFKKDDATWFKSTEFGDDKDRVIRKASGDLTYVAADIAYMEDKSQRGFDTMVLILGHDHHSYGIRLEGLRKALGIKASLQVILYQLVRMKSGGEMVRMSKRTGNIVMLKDVIEKVGTDVARFFYLNRKADAQLEFDLDLALKKTDENPVYYIQYAYVRTGSILQKAELETKLKNITEQDYCYINKEEQLLIKKIISLKNILNTISKNFQTHQLTYYLLELANTFHSYYGKNRVIDMENIKKSRARLLLIKQLREVFELCLDLLGISKPKKM